MSRLASKKAGRLCVRRASVRSAMAAKARHLLFSRRFSKASRNNALHLPGRKSSARVLRGHAVRHDEASLLKEANDSVFRPYAAGIWTRDYKRA
ncbi:hypothetical protein ACFFYR_01210 [Paraburkholderia dipogonis]|uniref:hypothetical protein n=1 Tax=Paraburkholderia dipogonis TaxID=1211383 RepID=UPI0035EEB1A8